MKRLMTLFLSAAMAVVSYAGVLPSVGNGTAPNQWTSNVEGVLAAAKTTGYPILALIINDSNSGEGCDHCTAFLESTVNTAAFENLKRSNTFYLVLLNYWQGANGYHSNPDPYYYRWFTPGTGIYARQEVLPVIAVVDPFSGAKTTQWGVPWGDYGNKTAQIKAVLDLYVHRTSLFSIEAESASVRVAKGSQGTWQGWVARSGGSGLAGNATISLSGPHAAYYTVSPSTLFWGAEDDAKAFTVTGPSTQDDVLYDEIVVSIAGSCPGGDVAYGNQLKTVVFRDARIRKSLEEFAAEHDGLQGLTAASEIWFASTENTLALETIMDVEEDTLTLNATRAGKLTLALPADFPESASASVTWTSSGQSAQASLSAEAKTIGVSVGDRVEIKVTNTAQDTLVGFETFEFEPLELALAKPVANAIFSWPDLCADHSLVDFAWSSPNAGTPDYELYLTQGGVGSVFEGTPVPMGEATGANGIDVGLVRTDIVMGNCWWGVKVTDSSADIGRATTTATASFSITAAPEYDSPVEAVMGYLKCGVGYDFSAWAPAGTGDIAYSLSGKLPSGLTLNKVTGQITGTPKKAGSYSFTVRAANAYGVAAKSVTIVVAKFPTAFKGNYNGIFFAGKSMPYSMTWKVATSGKWSGKLALPDGKTKSIKGTIVFDKSGYATLQSAELTIRQVPGTALWTGAWGGATLWGKATEKKIAASAVGLWTAGVQAGADPSTGAYVVSKITSNGKVSFSGNANATLKLGGKGQALSLTGAEIETYIPAWANGGQSAVFAQGCKKASGKVFCGGFAYWQDRSCEGIVTHGGRVYDRVEGSYWNTKQSLASLDGATFVAGGDFGEIAFGVTATDKKLSAVADGVKLSAKVSKGTVSGSFRNGKKTCKFNGALFISRAGGLKAFGGVQGNGHFMIGK